MHFIFLLFTDLFLSPNWHSCWRKKKLIKEKRKGKPQKFFFLDIFKLFVSSSLRVTWDLWGDQGISAVFLLVNVGKLEFFTCIFYLLCLSWLPVLTRQMLTRDELGKGEKTLADMFKAKSFPFGKKGIVRISWKHILGKKILFLFSQYLNDKVLVCRGAFWY